MVFTEKRIPKEAIESSQKEEQIQLDTGLMFYNLCYELMRSINKHSMTGKYVAMWNGLEQLYSTVKPYIKEKNTLELLNKLQTEIRDILTLKYNQQSTYSWNPSMVTKVKSQKAKPLMMEFQNNLYSEMYKLKLVIGGEKNG